MKFTGYLCDADDYDDWCHRNSVHGEGWAHLTDADYCPYCADKAILLRAKRYQWEHGGREAAEAARLKAAEDALRAMMANPNPVLASDREIVGAERANG